MRGLGIFNEFPELSGIFSSNSELMLRSICEVRWRRGFLPGGVTWWMVSEGTQPMNHDEGMKPHSWHVRINFVEFTIHHLCHVDEREVNDGNCPLLARHQRGQMVPNGTTRSARAASNHRSRAFACQL